MGVRQNDNPIGKRLRVKDAGVGTACKMRRQRNLAEIQCEEGMQNADKVLSIKFIKCLGGRELPRGGCSVSLPNKFISYYCEGTRTYY